MHFPGRNTKLHENACATGKSLLVGHFGHPVFQDYLLPFLPASQDTFPIRHTTASYGIGYQRDRSLYFNMRGMSSGIK